MKELGGIDGILDGLRVDAENGINTNTLESRTIAFGDHKKDLPERTGFW